MIESLKGKVEEHLIEKMKKIYEKTHVVVKIPEGFTKKFRTRKGVRQECVMNPFLFDLYIANIDKFFKERNISGIEIGKSRIWMLAYANDMVLLAKNRVAIQDMMDTFKRFTKSKKLELNTEKTKTLIFNRTKEGKARGMEVEGKKNRRGALF